MTERERLIKVLGVLGLNFNREITPALVEFFTTLLQTMTIEQVEEGASRIIEGNNSGRHQFPTLGDLREAVLGTVEQRAENAYEVCLRNSRCDDSVRFTDDAITVAVERTAGNWQQWCDWCRWMPEEQFQWKRRDWLRHYKDAVALNVKPSCLYFIGYLESQGNLLGTGYGEPQLKLVARDGSSETKLLAQWNE